MSEPAGGPFPPPGYRRWRQAGHDVVALESAADAVRGALEGAASLHRWAAGRAERSLAGGRGPLHVARLGDRAVAVRHYRRGGWMAPLLGDRYLDRPPRPFAELAVSDRLRGAGVHTPRVVAAVVTPARPGYRADLATAWLSPSHDLAALLRPGAYPDATRHAALEAAGEAVGRAHAAGLDHPDLNLGNVLVIPRPDDGWDAALVDLDRARFGERGPATARRNLARLERSLAGARRAGRVGWTDGDRAALLAGHTRGVRGAS